MALVLIGIGTGGCSVSRTDGSFAKMGDDLTASLGPAAHARDPTTPGAPPDSEPEPDPAAASWHCAAVA